MINNDINNKKPKKLIIVLCFPFILISIIIVYLLILHKMLLPHYKTYNTIKNECIDFLENNIYNLTKLSEEYISNSNMENVDYLNVKSIYYGKTKLNEEYIKFHIDSQGLLGGQYWGLYYIPENKYLGHLDIYIYDESQDNGIGNNIFIVQKLQDHWFFYYEDYDGKIDISKFK